MDRTGCAEHVDAGSARQPRLLDQLKDGTRPHHRRRARALERRRHRAAQRRLRWPACSPRCIRTRRCARSPRSARRRSAASAPTSASTARCTRCSPRPTPTPATPAPTRLREHVLRDFRRSGVDRDDAVRDRLREIAERLTVLDQDFGRAIRDDVRSIRVRPEQLDGLPQDFSRRAPGRRRRAGHAHDRLPRPHAGPHVRARRRGAPRRSPSSFLNRGWPANDAVLHEMLDLRAEQAGLLGYDSWPDYDAEVKMIGSGEAILEFIDQLTAAADDAARRDFDVLLARGRAGRPGRDRARPAPTRSTTRSSSGASTSTSTRSRCAATSTSRRVRAGLLDVTARLFGIEYRPRPTCPLWHEDVAGYDVAVDGALIGRIYLDLHPREGKFKHAAQFDLRRRHRRPAAARGRAGVQLPARADGAQPTSSRCSTSSAIWCTTCSAASSSGRGSPASPPSGTSSRRRRRCSRNGPGTPTSCRASPRTPTATPIPPELVARMRAADEFGKGCFVRTQMFYAALSYLLHRDRPDDLTAAVRDRAAALRPVRLHRGTHFHASFGHLAGYTSAYYTYLWSLVIAKDLFSAFDRDLLDPAVGAPLPRRGAGAGRLSRRGRPGRGLPRPAVLLRRVRGWLATVSRSARWRGRSPGVTTSKDTSSSKVDPPSSFTGLRTESEPPMSSARRRVIASPSPVPPYLRSWRRRPG